MKALPYLNRSNTHVDFDFIFSDDLESTHHVSNVIKVIDCVT